MACHLKEQYIPELNVQAEKTKQNSKNKVKQKYRGAKVAVVTQRL
jgi:hypothetical protein